ncbi:MAG: bile acid:sodium symporter [Proteobacteria bacterium]|nr:bile acid:sodium symporter [Pseudomonadota bacterium]MBU4275209.1 bile acid:sodium symporter [Pseudomonadota bacterium]MBU4382486.1 bile acid:sodium symporter [Pseudomonadota bacterium]MBU4604490.1 bile acid:sodium symporter [Pseudomonadota bacterium]MCG2765003.1 bile acid:sodium symporter [Desulfarculaceae bacterium]
MGLFARVISKYLPLWVGLDIAVAITVGYLFPAVSVLEHLVPFLVFLMLYPMMINLRIEEVGKAFKHPKMLLAALVLNFLVTPLLGWVWARLFFSNTDSFLTAGFILKTLIPGSGMVAAWTGYARGKVGSALVIVAVSMLLSLVMVPVWMWVLAGAYVVIEPLVIFRAMGIIVVAPLLAGVLTRRLMIRRWGQARFKEVAPLFPVLSTCAMLPMLFIIISFQAVMIVDNYWWMLLVIAAIASMYSVLFLLSVGFAKVTGMDYGDAMAMGYSVTAKAHAITIGVAATVFGGTLAVLPAAVAPVIQVPLMMVILKLSGRVEKFLSPLPAQGPRP